MDQVYVLKKTISILEKLGIDYMITGGLAVLTWGRIRATHDIDLVVEIEPADISQIVKEFRKANFYISEEGIKEAVQRQTTFNVIHQPSAEQVDLWIAEKTIYSQIRFKHRFKKKLFNKDFYIISPEDLMIIKLKWYKDSNSDRHYLDALSIYELQKDKLNIKYLDKWTKHQKCYQLLKEIKENKSRFSWPS